MHFLQSTAWQSFQKQLGRKTYRQSGKGWEYLAILEVGTKNTRLYCPYGPYAENRRAFEEAMESLIALGHRHNVTFVRVEPTEPEYAEYIQAHGGHRVTYQSLNPEFSRVIDLQIPEDELIARMAQPVRNCYRNYQKKGVKVMSSTDPLKIDMLTQLLREVSARTGMRPHDDNYFWAQATSLFPTGAATLWYATYQDKPIAAALMYNDSTTRYYAHAAASSLTEYRKLNAGAALVAEAIVDAKRQGLSYFDLYGIAPDGSSPYHPWAGFTKFKRSFGGEDVTFGGSWDISLQPVEYWLYRIYQTVRRYF